MAGLDGTSNALPWRGGMGDQFDIHGGATDLIFPHHENEVAQTESVTGKHPMARFWMHAGLLLVDGQKMSKSLGNFEPLTSVLARHSPAAIRYLFLQTGYRKPTNYTEEAIGAASEGLRRLYDGLDRLRREAGSIAPVDFKVDRYVSFEEFDAFLDDDLNTAGALGWMQTRVRSESITVGLVERCLETLGLPSTAAAAGLAGPSKEIRLSDDARRALTDLVENGSVDDVALVQAVVDLRTKARAEKDFRKSDRLRDALAAAGISIKDSKSGTDWFVDGGR
jgi:cysteinyl-tRNA synthetase